jgi:hypothetical protein
MTDMRTRLARIAASEIYDVDFDALTSVEREHYLLIVDAILAELESPTEAMVEASSRADGHRARGYFRRMIRAAKEGK